MSDSEFNCSYDSDSDVMDSVRKRQLLNQIAEVQHEDIIECVLETRRLQNAVTDMKSAFTVAIQQLSRVQLDDQGLSDKIEQNKTECLDQVSEVFKLMFTMKAEFVTLKNQMNASNETQQNLQRQVQNLIWERDLLIEELYKSGSISDEIRYHLQNPRQVGRASSGSHSNDSGVILVLEKGQPTFQNNSPFLTSSDQDYMSIPDQCPPISISHLVHDYVAGLEHSQPQSKQRTVSSFGDGDSSTLAYDSDSSLVNAANKSLSLSTSLGKQCGLELDHCDVGSDDDDPSDNTAPDVTVEECKKPVLHTESGKRWMVFKETLETERRYCKALWTLQDTFAVPLKQSGILSSKDINTLFPEEIFQLYGKHCILLHSLEERMQSWGRHGTIGDIFEKFTDPNESNILQLYTTYVDDFPEVLKTFHKLCRQSPKFTRFLKSCMLQPSCGGLDLGAYLVTPVQRVPHYILLLKRMLQVTEEGHIDTKLLNNCLQRLKDFLDRLNDTMEHSFQLITAQIQPEDDPEQRPSRCAKSKPKHTAIEGAAALPNINTAKGNNEDENCCKNGQGKNCHILCKSQSEVMNLQTNVKLSSINRTKLRKKCRSESLVSSLSANSENDDDCNCSNQRMKGSGTALDLNVNTRQTDRQQLYYWQDDSQYNCESGPDSIGTDDSNNSMALIKNAGNLLRHISEDSDTDGDTSNLPEETDDSERDVAPRSNILTSKSMQDVKQIECPTRLVDGGSSDKIASSQPNLVESEITDPPPKCCHSNYCAIGRGVSMACISPSEKELGGRGGKEEGRSRSRWGRRPLGKAQSSHSVHNLAKEQICGCPTAEDNYKTSKKKKNFLRTSLKNILLFKKRNNSRTIVTSKSSSQVVESVAISSDETEKTSVCSDGVGVRCRRPSTDSSLEQCGDCGQVSRDPANTGCCCAGRLHSSSAV